MRKRALILLAVAAILLVGYAARVVTVRALHNDACLAISKLVANKIEKGEPVSETAVKDEVARLIRASVIHGRIASDGSPTDLNGHSFLIQHTTEKVTASTKFSLLQPITSHAETGIKSHNDRSGVDAGMEHGHPGGSCVATERSILVISCWFAFSS